MALRIWWMLSLLCCLFFTAVIVLWVQSYLSPYVQKQETSLSTQEGKRHRDTTFKISSRGWLGWGKAKTWYYFKSNTWGLGETKLWQIYDCFLRHPDNATWKNREVDVGTTEDSISSCSYKLFKIPHWAFAAVTGSLATLVVRATLRRNRRQRWLRRNLCTQCGYDLRESPTRCPECGTSRVTMAANPSAQSHSG